MLMPAQFLRIDTEVTHIPVPAILLNSLISFFILVWFHKKLRIGLLKLASTKQEIARTNLVAKGFANLSDAKRNFHARRVDNVFEIEINPLTCLTR